MRVRAAFPILFILFSLSLLLCPGFTGASQETEKQRASIVGEVVIEVPQGGPFPQIAGKTLPKQSFPVYLFTWKESAAIREWLEKLTSDMEALNENPNDSEKRWIAEKRAEDIYRMVVAAGPSHVKKTDKQGRFAFDNLKVGERYLVIGAKLEHAEGHILLPQIVGPLAPGENKVRLVEK